MCEALVGLGSDADADDEEAPAAILAPFVAVALAAEAREPDRALLGVIAACEGALGLLGAPAPRRFPRRKRPFRAGSTAATFANFERGVRAELNVDAFVVSSWLAHDFAANFFYNFVRNAPAAHVDGRRAPPRGDGDIRADWRGVGLFTYVRRNSPRRLADVTLRNIAEQDAVLRAAKGSTEPYAAHLSPWCLDVGGGMISRFSSVFCYDPRYRAVYCVVWRDFFAKTNFVANK